MDEDVAKVEQSFVSYVKNIIDKHHSKDIGHSGYKILSIGWKLWNRICILVQFCVLTASSETQPQRR